MTRPARPSIAEIRATCQPQAVRGRRNEHWVADVYIRRVSPYLTRALIATPISANGVTVLMIVTVWAAALVLTIPNLLGPVLAAILVQLQMTWDASDGEVARWRQVFSPRGIFLDGVGHYTGETLLAVALGVRAAGGLTKIASHPGWVLLGALLGLVLGFNKALNDMVRATRAAVGLELLPDAPNIGTPRGSVLARLRRLARLLPFHRMFHSVEFSLAVLVVGIVDAVRGDLTVTRYFLEVVLPLAVLAVCGHFTAIMTSGKLRA